MSKEGTDNYHYYKQVLQPETDLEDRFLNDPEFVNGLSWGTPRYGHPEGQVYKHIREVLDNIDLLRLSPERRVDLRIIAMVHDTFKYREHKGVPRDWSKHHAVYARKFLEKYHDDEHVLKVTEVHDEAYYCWCTRFLYHRPEKAQIRLDKLLEHLGETIDLYYHFFWADTCTGDKNLAPLKWFEETIPDIRPISIENLPEKN